jgi:hypothetical protein
MKMKIGLTGFILLLLLALTMGAAVVSLTQGSVSEETILVNNGKITTVPAPATRKVLVSPALPLPVKKVVKAPERVLEIREIVVAFSKTYESPSQSVCETKIPGVGTIQTVVTTVSSFTPEEAILDREQTTDINRATYATNMEGVVQ